MSKLVRDALRSRNQVNGEPLKGFTKEEIDEPLL